MAAEDQQREPLPQLPRGEERLALAEAWRRLARLATLVATLTSPRRSSSSHSDPLADH